MGNACCSSGEQQIIFDTEQRPLELKIQAIQNQQSLFINQIIQLKAEGKPYHQQIMTCSSEGHLSLWQKVSGVIKCLLTVQHSPKKEPVHTIAQLNSTTVISGGQDGFIKFWELPKLENLFDLQSEAVNCVIALNENQILSTSENNSINLWDVTQRQITKTWKEHTHWVGQVEILDDKIFVSVALDLNIKVWNLDEEKSLTTITDEQNQFWMSIPTIKKLSPTEFLVGYNNGSLHKYNIKGELLTKAMPHSHKIRQILITFNNFISTISQDSFLKLLDKDTLKVVKDIDIGQGLRAQCELSDGSIMVSTFDRNLYLII